MAQILPAFAAPLVFAKLEGVGGPNEPLG